jgi:hypothetical protein
MNMAKDFIGEQWKKLKFNFEYTNEGHLEVSNFGRVRTFNKTSNGNLLAGSMINGYKIIRLKLYKPREEAVAQKLAAMQKTNARLLKKLSLQKINKAPKADIKETTELLMTARAKATKAFAADTKARTINYHSLIHRLVADYFLKKPTAKQTIVAHLDFNKLNNKASNLKWMTPEENQEHQTRSPYVIAEKKERYKRPRENSRATKLTTTKVMLLKKLLAQEKPMKTLVKIFKVTETQILRIKRGENWGHVVAPK